MKIAYLLNTYPAPSQSFIRREILGLERRGIEVVRLAARQFDDPLIDPANLAERDRTHYILGQGAGALAVAFVRRCLANPKAALRAVGLTRRMARASGGNWIRHLAYLIEAGYVAQHCRDLRVAHVHCHFGTNAPAIALLARTLGGPSYSFTVHGPEEFDAPVVLSLGLKIEHAAFVVGVSQFGRSQLSRWADFDDWARIKVVHCGIEPAAFATPKLLPAQPPLRVVSIGRFVEQKGQMVLVQALSRLRDSHPDLHLTLVGDGEMRGDLEGAIAAAGLKDRVTLTGWVDEVRVNSELANAHALVMPSFAEGLPVVLMEAMAAGRPAICTYIAGIPELLTPDCGWLVPAGDPAALADALARLAETPPEALAEMGRKSRERALVRHDIDTEVAKLADHFSAAIDPQATA